MVGVVMNLPVRKWSRPAADHRDIGNNSPSEPPKETHFGNNVILDFQPPEM